MQNQRGCWQIAIHLCQVNLKNLMIFQETFNRSLSENNYLHYQSEKYNSDNVLIERSEKSWNLSYDDSGYPVFNEY